MRIQVAVSAGVAATSAAGETNRSLGISISTGRAIPLDFHTPPPLVVFFTPPFFRLFRFTSRLPHGYCATAAAAAAAATGTRCSFLPHSHNQLLIYASARSMRFQIPRGLFKSIFN